MSELPDHLLNLPEADFEALLAFANKVQRWSIRRSDQSGTFGDAADHFKVAVQRIADAVAAHYWLFTTDDDLPIAQRRIEHEGE